MADATITITMDPGTQLAIERLAASLNALTDQLREASVTEHLARVTAQLKGAPVDVSVSHDPFAPEPATVDGQLDDRYTETAGEPEGAEVPVEALPADETEQADPAPPESEPEAAPAVAEPAPAPEPEAQPVPETPAVTEPESEPQPDPTPPAPETVPAVSEPAPDPTPAAESAGPTEGGSDAIPRS